MPIYEYVCRECNKKFEVITRTSDAPGACPHCGSSDAQLQLSVFAGRSTNGGARPSAGGGCCGGGGCGCH